MDREAYATVFHLNETELDLIQNLTPRRQFMMKQPKRSKVLNLNLDRKSYWLITSTPHEADRRGEVFEEHGLRQGLEILAKE